MEERAREMRKPIHKLRLWAALHVMPKCCRDQVYANERVAAAVEPEAVARERMAEAKRLGRKYAKAWQREDVAVMDQLEATARDRGNHFRTEGERAVRYRLFNDDERGQCRLCGVLLDHPGPPQECAECQLGEPL